MPLLGSSRWRVLGCLKLCQIGQFKPKEQGFVQSHGILSEAHKREALGGRGSLGLLGTSCQTLAFPCDSEAL